MLRIYNLFCALPSVLISNPRDFSDLIMHADARFWTTDLLTSTDAEATLHCIVGCSCASEARPARNGLYRLHCMMAWLMSLESVFHPFIIAC